MSTTAYCAANDCVAAQLARVTSTNSRARRVHCLFGLHSPLMAQVSTLLRRGAENGQFRGKVDPRCQL